MNRKQKYEERLLQEQYGKMMRLLVLPISLLFALILATYVIVPLFGLPLDITSRINRASYVFGILLLYCNIFLLNQNYKTVNEKRHMVEPSSAVFILCTIAVTGGIICAFLLAKYENTQGFYSKEMNGYTITRSMSLYGALLFLPALALPIHYLIPWTYLRPQIKRNYDYLIIGVYSIMGFVKFGCHAGGCCYGIRIDAGLFNRASFPVQLAEGLSIMITLVFLMWYQMKCKSRIIGASYPIGLLLYCPVRFVWEFFRTQEGFVRMHVFNGLMTFWQFLSIIGFVAGAVWLGILLWRRASARKQPAMAQ